MKKIIMLIMKNNKMNMKILFVLLMTFAISCWSIPKPMESVENYNVMIVHGAYGSGQTLNVK